MLLSSLNPSRPLVTPLNTRRLRRPQTSVATSATLVSGKEKLHLFHRDGEEGMMRVAAKGLVSRTGMMFSSGRQIFLLSGLGETHAGDTDDTDEASVLEELESSELSSTFFPKSCKMQFRNWQDRKYYSAEQEGPACHARGNAWGIRRKVFIVTWMTWHFLSTVWNPRASGGRLRLFFTHEDSLTIRLSKSSNLAVDGDCCESHGVPPKYMLGPTVWSLGAWPYLEIVFAFVINMYDTMSLCRREFGHRRTGTEGRRVCGGEGRDRGDSSTNQGTASSHQELGEGHGEILPESAQKEPTLLTPRSRTSGLQSWEAICSRSSKPPNL